MLPESAPFSATENTPEFRAVMSAHEAGHATMGITLGARIEAVYALVASKLPNGNFRIVYFTRFGALGRAGLGLRDRILLTAGGAAGEFLLNGAWDNPCVAVDQSQVNELGFFNFDYCVERSIQLLEGNIALLTAVRDMIKLRMSDLKHCKLAKGGSHVTIATGLEITKLFSELGSSVDSSCLDLEIARIKVGKT